MQREHCVHCVKLSVIAPGTPRTLRYVLFLQLGRRWCCSTAGAVSLAMAFLRGALKWNWMETRYCCCALPLVCAPYSSEPERNTQRALGGLGRATHQYRYRPCWKTLIVWPRCASMSYTANTADNNTITATYYLVMNTSHMLRHSINVPMSTDTPVTREVLVTLGQCHLRLHPQLPVVRISSGPYEALLYTCNPCMPATTPPSLRHAGIRLSWLSTKSVELHCTAVQLIVRVHPGPPPARHHPAPTLRRTDVTANHVGAGLGASRLPSASPGQLAREVVHARLVGGVVGRALEESTRAHAQGYWFQQCPKLLP